MRGQVQEIRVNLCILCFGWNFCSADKISSHSVLWEFFILNQKSSWSIYFLILRLIRSHSGISDFFILLLDQQSSEMQRELWKKYKNVLQDWLYWFLGLGYFLLKYKKFSFLEKYKTFFHIDFFLFLGLEAGKYPK